MISSKNIQYLSRVVIIRLGNFHNDIELIIVFINKYSNQVLFLINCNVHSYVIFNNPVVGAHYNMSIYKDLFFMTYLNVKYLTTVIAWKID